MAPYGAFVFCTLATAYPRLRNEDRDNLSSVPSGPTKLAANSFPTSSGDISPISSAVRNYQATAIGARAVATAVGGYPTMALFCDCTSEESSVPLTANSFISRGFAYNQASLTSSFSSAKVGWIYNWDSAPGDLNDRSKEYVPMLWNISHNLHAAHWRERAEGAIAAGTRHLLAFNEPDLPTQADMDIEQSVAGWMDFMEPFHSKYQGDIKLGSPSVCASPEEHIGLSYLQDFLDRCHECHIDFIAIHWYGLANNDGIQQLKDHVGKARDIAGGRAIWLTEFKSDGTDQQQAEFLSKILPWLDDIANGVQRYAYFMLDTMVNASFTFTEAGSVYAT